MILTPNYTVSLLESNGRHFYTVDNDPTFYPGPTTVLSVVSKPYLLPWVAKTTSLYIQEKLLKLNDRMLPPRFIETLCKRAKKQHRFLKEKAGDIGTRGHKAMDAITKGLPIEKDATVEFILEGFNHLLELNMLKIIQGDTKVASLEYGFGGSLDAFGLDKENKLCVLDYKTSNQISDEYALQVSSYCYAAKETFSLPYLPDGYIIRLGKAKPEVEIRKIRSVEESFEGFRCALGLYRYMQEVPYISRNIYRPTKTKETTNATKTRTKKERVRKD